MLVEAPAQMDTGEGGAGQRRRTFAHVQCAGRAARRLKALGDAGRAAIPTTARAGLELPRALPGGLGRAGAFEQLLALGETDVGDDVQRIGGEGSAEGVGRGARFAELEQREPELTLGINAAWQGGERAT